MSWDLAVPDLRIYHKGRTGKIHKSILYSTQGYSRQWDLKTLFGSCSLTSYDIGSTKSSDTKCTDVNMVTESRMLILSSVYKPQVTKNDVYCECAISILYKYTYK